MSTRSPGTSSASCVEQLVAVRRAVAQEQQDGGLGEALDPRAHAPRPARPPPQRAVRACQCIQTIYRM